jgi:geranyl-CoA carboxylase alpha subunit
VQIARRLGMRPVICANAFDTDRPNELDMIERAAREWGIPAAVSTAFVERHFPDGALRASVPDDRTWALAAWLSTAAAPEATGSGGEWRNWSTGRSLPTPWRLDWQAPQSLQSPAASSRLGRIFLAPQGAVLAMGEQRLNVRGQPAVPCSDGQVEIDGETVPYRHAWQGRRLWLHTRQGDYEFLCRRRESLRSSADDTARGGDVRAAINGRVLDIAVAPGDEVSAGQRLLVLEAMKMEHELRAAAPGRVAAVEVRVGDQVAPGQTLVRMERGS